MAKAPYEEFGKQLKEIREKAKESVAELSGAVELDANQIEQIEAGNDQPSEDIVLLIISHFSLKEDEALKLWELAGYKQSQTGLSSMISDSKEGVVVKTAFVHPSDARILYTDMVHVSANKYGVIINFLQGLGNSDQPMAVSRVGMSHEHAQSLLQVLKSTIDVSKQENTDQKSSKKSNEK